MELDLLSHDKTLNKIKKIKNHSKPSKLVSNHFSSNFNKIPIFFWFFTETLTLSLPVPLSAGDNTDLPSDSNISKTVRVKIAFTRRLFKEYSTSFLMVCRLIDFALVVLRLLMFKVCGSIGISKIEFFNYSGNERVNLN